MISLSTIALVAGVVLIVFGAGGLWRADAIRRMLDAFPRHRIAAILLTLFNVLWVAVMIYHAPLGRFEWIKPFLYVLAPATFFAVIHYMDELLAPRMLGAFLLLMANPALNAARWHESPWRLVLTVLVYGWIIWAIILVLSPYRFRHITEWTFRAGRRVFVFGATLLLGLALTGLAVAVY